MKSTSRRVFSRFSTTSPSVLTYRALKSLRHHSSGRCASRSATGPRHERAEGRLCRFAFDGITMVDDGPPCVLGSRLLARSWRPRRDAACGRPRRDPIWISAKRERISPSQSTVKLLSVDDRSQMQALFGERVPRQHSSLAQEAGDEEAVRCLTRGCEQQLVVPAIGRLWLDAADATQPG